MIIQIFELDAACYFKIRIGYGIAHTVWASDVDPWCEENEENAELMKIAVEIFTLHYSNLIQVKIRLKRATITDTLSYLKLAFVSFCFFFVLLF